MKGLFFIILLITTNCNLNASLLNKNFKKRKDLIYSRDRLGLAKILKGDITNGTKENEIKLNQYYALSSDGERLKNYCYHQPTIKYPKEWGRVQAKRVLLSSLQYQGLLLTMNAITAYSKELQYTRDEFNNLATNLTSNYCSRNITFIGHESLKKYFVGKFDKNDLNFKLPSIEDNSFFPDLVRGIASKEEKLKRELFQTVKLFRAFCSWGNDVNNLRLLVPLVKNPIVMAYTIRQLTNQQIDIDENGEKIGYQTFDSGVYMSCREFVCRKTTFHKFKKTMPHPIGESSIQNDFDRLYCEDLRRVDYSYVNQESNIKNFIKKESFDEAFLMVAQYVALISKIPDFIVWSKTFKEAKNAMRSGVDRYFDSWAKEQSSYFGDDLFYEGPLTIEKIDPNFYRDDYNLKVVLNVNMGEFDRNSELYDKIKVYFNINIEHNFLVDIRYRWRGTISTDVKERDFLLNRFIKHIEDKIKITRSKFPLPTWNRGLAKLISMDFLEQIVNSKSKEFNVRRKGMRALKVELRYSPFALKYLHYKKITGTELVQED